MTCYNNCYLPIPPRDWSRVQNSCSIITDTENNSPVLGENNAMLNKGNILQYKANSSNLTQKQKYSKMAQGKWTNRNTTWATQNTRGYTNPNTTSLKRSGNVNNVAIDPITGTIIGTTTQPVTCLKPITQVNEGLPSNGGGGSGEPLIPPPVEPTPASDTFPATITDTPAEPIVIQDEGILICSVQENICTGETKSTLSQQLCNPTSDSDVPGTIQLLCWNDGTPTWYPRSRYVMSNSTNKWPVNAVLSSSVRPYPPTITSVTYNSNIITLIWVQSKNCLPISEYEIFQNGILIQIVSGTIFTTNVPVDSCGTYEYFIIAVTNGSKINSEPSNTMSINLNTSSPPQKLVVNWACADYSNEIMDINMNFETPANILCGTPKYFVLNVYNSKNYIIETTTIDYVAEQTQYEVNFNNVLYSAFGTISVYLVTINNGQTVNGDVATCDYTSSDLPIYVNSTMNANRTEWSFTIITQGELCLVAGIIIPDPESLTMTYIYWDTIPIVSDYLTITLTTLVNNENSYNVTMSPGIIGSTELVFPSIIGCVTSNKSGISPNVSSSGP